MRHTALLLAVTLLAALHAAAQDAPPPQAQSARIDGAVLIGGKPCPNEKIILFNMRERKPIPPVITDTQGKFSFPNVAPGIYGIGCLRDFPHRASKFNLTFNNPTATRCLCIDPGETINIQLGGTGRTLTGRLTLPPNATLTPAWQGAKVRYLSSVLDIPAPPENLPDAEKEAWFNQQLQTPAFQALMEKRLSLVVELHEDGQFTIPDVPPGKYQLEIQIADDTTGNDKPAGGIKREIDVPEGTEPYALGDIPIDILARIEPGAPAPDFTATTLDGASITLSSLKGKPVLLDFWATWCAPCRMEVPHIKEIHQRFGDAITIIGLSRDRAKAPLEAYIKDNALPWPQIYLRDIKHTDIADTYQVNAIPSIILIGPDGNILATQLRGAAITTAIEKALATKK